MSETVYVVTGLELGWDCVCGVFRNYEDAVAYTMESLEDVPEDEISDYLNDDGYADHYVIHSKTLK